MINNLKLSTEVKKQHTVPRFLLDRFGFGEKGRKRKLFTFDKQNERVFQQSVFDATTRNKFYNIDNHPDKASLEPLLGEYEKQTAPVIKKIIEEESITGISPEDRLTLASFVAIQSSRSYGEHQRINDALNKVNDKLERLLTIHSGLEPTTSNKEQRENKNVFLETILDQEETIDHLMRKTWVLYQTDMDNPFYISDNPITLHNDIDMGMHGNIGIALKGIQIHMPLSSTLTLALLCPSICEPYIDNKNRLVTAQSKGISNSNKLIDFAEAIESGKPMHLSERNVVFLNNLQVRYSEQYIFCQKDKFRSVREMLSVSCRFRSGPRFKIN